MKRWMKTVLLFVGLVVVGINLISLFFNANTFRPMIEKRLTTTLGRSVKLGELSLSLFSGGLVAKDLSVADDPSFSDTPFLTAKELRIGISLRQLIFSHQVSVRSLQIESPQITAIRATDTWNFANIGTPVVSADTASGNAKGSAPKLHDLSVGSIAIEDGRVLIANLPAHSQRRVYDHVNITARDFSFASQFPFELSANLPVSGTISVKGHIGPINRDEAVFSPGEAQIAVRRLSPVAAGFLNPNAGLSFLTDIDMHAASDGQTITTSGRVDIQHLRLHKGAAIAPKPLDITYSGTYRLKENSGQIEDATAKIGGATIHVNGTYQSGTLGTKNLILNLKMGGLGLAIDELQPLMTAAAVRLPDGSTLIGGKLSMNLAITGPTKSLVITGPIELDNTRLVGFDVGSKIHGIAALGGLKTGNTTDFEKLRVNVRIANDGVVADDLDGIIPSMGEFTGRGTVSSADQLDFDLLVKVESAKGIGKIGVALLTKLNGSDGTSGNATGIPMRVVGTPDDPYITADVGGIARRKINSIGSIFTKK